MAFKLFCKNVPSNRLYSLIDIILINLAPKYIKMKMNNFTYQDDLALIDHRHVYN